MTTEFVDASIAGELDWRDNETWYDFVDPIRRDYIIKKDNEEMKNKARPIKETETKG